MRSKLQSLRKLGKLLNLNALRFPLKHENCNKFAFQNFLIFTN